MNIKHDLSPLVFTILEEENACKVVLKIFCYSMF